MCNQFDPSLLGAGMDYKTLATPTTKDLSDCPKPEHPIVIPPDSIAPGVPSHPIVLPPPIPTHPIVIPPGAIDPGPPLVPAHPIVLPPPRPEHPIVIPPGSIGDGKPEHPIVLPPTPTVPLPESVPVVSVDELPPGSFNLVWHPVFGWVLVPVKE